MKHLWDFVDCLRLMRRQMRFGHFSRAPLRILQVELRGQAAACDWVARSPDAWDTDLPHRARERNASRQALQDALAVRDLLFHELPEIESAVLRAFRQPAREPPELIINGTVDRQAEDVQGIDSLMMRARLYGLQFYLHDERLQPLQIEDQEFRWDDRDSYQLGEENEKKCLP